MVVRQLCILTGASPSFALRDNIGRRRIFRSVIGAHGPSVDCSNADESGFIDEQEMRPEPSEANVGFEALIDVPGKFCD